MSQRLGGPSIGDRGGPSVTLMGGSRDLDKAEALESRVIVGQLNTGLQRHAGQAQDLRALHRQRYQLPGQTLALM